jgi:hypothetical protein
MRPISKPIPRRSKPSEENRYSLAESEKVDFSRNLPQSIVITAHNGDRVTNLDSGHGGASGRYEYLKDIALEYTFLLTVFDKMSN